jgi:outer membrane immunogenic protein
VRLGLQRRVAADLDKGIAVMRTTFAAAVTAVVAFSGSALADGVPEPYSAPVMLQVFDWSGFYVGLNGGWAGTHTGWTWDTPTGGNGLCQGDCTGITNTSHTHNEGILGGQIGIQQQFGVFVLGVEAAVDETLGDEDNGSAAACVGFAATPNMRCQTRFSELFTVGGRLGWTPVRPWLLYASGGFASAQVESKLTALNSAGAIQAGSDHFQDGGRQNGWYVGGGVEFALTPNMIVGAEYQHIDLGSSAQINTQTDQGLTYGASAGRDIDVNADLVRARISYKLGRERE